MNIALEKERDLRGKKVPWVSCRPFILNDRAALIHRPRRVTTHKISDRWPSHISVANWCGNVASGTKKFTFLGAPPRGRIVCARCEDAAVAAGLPSSAELAGEHVHTGGVVAVALLPGGRMTTKHTPGPWIARPDPTNPITGRDDWCIGVRGKAPDEVAVCSEQDARLIAAAPDLLEALTECMLGHSDVAGYGLGRIAIEKATKEQTP